MPKGKILIVEDEAIVAEDLSRKLERLDYEVSGMAGSGEEAVALARARRPDLVLMDIRLEGRMDGVEAAQIIHQESDIPVIYLTAHSDPTTLQRAKLTEPFGYILKPFEELELETHIQMALYKHQAERKLRESEEQFRALANSIPNLAWWANGDGSVTWYNQRWYEYTGTTPEQMEGWGWQSVHDPEMLPQVLERWKASIATGEPFEMEFPLRGADGAFRWFLTRVMPVRNAAGQVARWFGTNTDVSEAREAREVLTRGKRDLERLVEERTTALRELVADLEHFSYTITHDLRGPLRAMRSFGQIMLAGGCADCENTEHRDFLGRIVTGAGRMDQLITDALNYVKAARSELTLSPVDPGPLLRGILDTYPNLQPPKVEVRIEGELPLVMGNEAALTQCFGNLLGNAVKFAAPGVLPKVRVWAEEVRIEPPEASDPSLNSQLATLNSHVRVWVEDNGIGIPKEFQPRLFYMFQRASNTHEGNGIGLALVRKNMERMGGKAGVESEPGRGSRFWLRFQKAS